MTRSGHSEVTKMSGGIVDSSRIKPGRSDIILRFTGLSVRIVLGRWDITELWRQVNLSWFGNIEQKFKICSEVPLLEQRCHLETCISHIFRLSGFGRQMYGIVQDQGLKYSVQTIKNILAALQG